MDRVRGIRAGSGEIREEDSDVYESRFSLGFGMCCVRVFFPNSLCDHAPKS